MDLWNLGLGSPPRVRSRPPPMRTNRRRTGITSACAEQTQSERVTERCHKDHLRVCGADFSSYLRRNCPNGSPPRVRSRPGQGIGRQRGGGITSACAEQTRTIAAPPRQKVDHLRVCGADASISARNAVISWITSACAEQTGCILSGCCTLWDHLRVCGADRVVVLHNLSA